MVISSQSHQQNWPDVILMAVTSQIRTTARHREAIPDRLAGSRLAALSTSSRPSLPLEQRQIVKVIGSHPRLTGRVVKVIQGYYEVNFTQPHY